MTQFWLFIAYLIFGFVTHYSTHFVIECVIKGTMNTLPRFWQLFVLYGTIFAYILSIWVFCGWIVTMFGG